jgi:hypothetical protein
MRAETTLLAAEDYGMLARGWRLCGRRAER